jgi:hypothetical protein
VHVDWHPYSHLTILQAEETRAVHAFNAFVKVLHVLHMIHLLALAWEGFRLMNRLLVQLQQINMTGCKWSVWCAYSLEKHVDGHIYYMDMPL